MTKKICVHRIFLGVFGVTLAWLGLVFAAEDLPRDTGAITHRSEERHLSPSERVKLNAERAKADPTLRAKWDSKGWSPASVSALRVDNLPQEVLSKLREDKDLADRPMKIKISSENGAVVLEGVVNDSEERDLVGQKVGRMEGVSKVDNRLAIKTSNADLK